MHESLELQFHRGLRLAPWKTRAYLPSIGPNIATRTAEPFNEPTEKADSQRLFGAPDGLNELVWVHETDSTMRLAKWLLTERQTSASVGNFLVMAEYQHSGRGRLDRTWQAAAGSSMLLSIVLSDPLADGGWLDDLLLMGPLVSLAARAAVDERFAVRLDLKWPNDLVVQAAANAAAQAPVQAAASGPASAPAPGGEPGDGERGPSLSYAKVGGVLAEAVWSPGSQRPSVIVGIGLNVGAASVPVDVGQGATSIEALVYAGGAGGDEPAADPSDVRSRAELVASLTRQLVERQRNGAASVRTEWAQACCTIGQRVRVSRLDGGDTVGTAESIRGDGALMVRLGDGSITAITIGDVQHLRPEPLQPKN